MADILVLSETAVNDAVAQLKGLVTEIEEINITSNKAAGGAGRAYEKILEGEIRMEEVKTALKELILATADYLEKTKDDLLAADMKHNASKVGGN